MVKIAVIIAVSCALAKLVQTTDISSHQNAINRLYHDYSEWQENELDPQTYIGETYKLNNYSYDHFLTINKSCSRFAQRATTFIQDPKTPSDQLWYLKLLKYEVDACVEEHRHKGYLLAPVMSAKEGIQNTLPDIFANRLFYDTIADYRDSLILMKQIPQQLAQIKNLLDMGVKEGITHANESLYRARQQFNRLQVPDPTQSEFYKHFAIIGKKNLSGTLALQTEAQHVIKNEVLPAFKKLQDYIFGEYYKNLRPKAGVHSMRNGQQYYQACIDKYSSISGLNATDIHNIGLAEIQQLKMKALQSANDLGMGNLTFLQLATKLTSEDSNKFISDAEALHFVKSRLKTINQQLQKVFSWSVLQGYIFTLDVMLVPPDMEWTAFYNGRGMHINPKLLTRYETSALVLHEGNPGHHLDWKTTENKVDAPWFYRKPSHNYVAHIEGWGLYAEHLGHEMGAYDEGNQIFGYYSLNLMRAARLVVDTGIHALGWSRQEAVDYLVENTFSIEARVQKMVDRYIRWPGQALAYKIGERKILSVRRKLEKIDDNFDVRKFHDGVLNCKGPLNYLEECVRKWYFNDDIFFKDQPAFKTLLDLLSLFVPSL